MKAENHKATNQLTEERAAQIVEGMQNRTVAVFGDCMLDEFIWGDVTRISPEAPVPVVDIRRDSMRLGGAANVLANLTALGARACLISVIGNDQAGERLRAALHQAKALNVDDLLVVDEDRPSTVKTRIIAHNQLVVRADREKRTPVDSSIEQRLIDVLQKALTSADALVVSDYDKGAVTPHVLEQVLAQAHERSIPTLVDPKIRNFEYYHPATLITPNHHEALRLTNTEDYSDEGLHRAAQLIRKRIGCACVLVTRGERGMMLVEGEGEPVFVETAAREVYDVTGAGDTVIATLAAALISGATTLEAAMLANYAAGVVVSKVGTASVSAGELIKSVRLGELKGEQ
jgi:D-beta-D-heptose 7-phosphate kinase/D-beta-D-heptose 1-phosphate adenosyltransferase